MSTLRGLLFAALIMVLAACSSTSPPSRAAVSQPLPTITPGIVTEPRPSPSAADSAVASAGEVATATPLGEGPATATMVRLNIGGERYATLGDPSAPITMVEFSDYGCPFCRLYSSSAFPELKADYIDTGKIYYVFKDFPVVSSHPQAVIAAHAAECAGEQNKYWDMHGKLFATPDEWDTTEDVARSNFTRYAEVLGLDVNAFNQCIDQQRFADEIAQDFSEGRTLGLAGTPSFIINGKLLQGARPIEQLRPLLDRELAGR